MASVTITVGGSSGSTAFKSAVAELTDLKVGDELLWSESTGRSASSGSMTGSVVAEKQTVSMAFGPITSAQYAALKSAFGRNFYNVTVSVGGVEVASGKFYRGTISREAAVYAGGTLYYKGVELEIVEV